MPNPPEGFYEVHFPDLTGQRPHYVCILPWRDKPFTNFMMELFAACTQQIPDEKGKVKPRKSAIKPPPEEDDGLAKA